MRTNKTFSKRDEGIAVEGTYSNGRKVQGTILSVWNAGMRIDVKEVIDAAGNYRIEYGVPASMLIIKEA